MPFMACMGLGGVAIMPIMCMPPPMLGGRGECCMGPMPPYGPKELVLPSLLLPSDGEIRPFSVRKYKLLEA